MAICPNSHLLVLSCVLLCTKEFLRGIPSMSSEGLLLAAGIRIACTPSTSKRATTTSCTTVQLLRLSSRPSPQPPALLSVPIALQDEDERPLPLLLMLLLSCEHAITEACGVTPPPPQPPPLPLPPYHYFSGLAASSCNCRQHRQRAHPPQRIRV